MKKKVLALVIGSALTVPSAFAAQDTSGMHFTSASEGFYASVRARFNSNGGEEDADGNIGNSGSRFGVRGTNDLGGGLEGFYQYEAGVSIDNGGGLKTRLGHVGLRGNFGEVIVGSFWTNDYNWVHGSTDVANTDGGNFIYSADREGRTSNSLQYTTPDLNGFQGALRVRAQGDNKAAGKDQDNDLDAWNIAAIYEIQGFSVAGSYQNRADSLSKPNAVAEAVATVASELYRDSAAAYNTALIAQRLVAGNNTNVAGLSDPSALEAVAAAVADEKLAVLDAEAATSNADTRAALAEASAVIRTAADDAASADAEDATSWSVRLGYAQDNWYVNGWYGEDNASDGSATDDTEIFSVGGGVSIDKVSLYALYEQQDKDKVKDRNSAIGAQYSLGSNSRVWIEYVNQDLDSSTTEEDYVSIGLRHDF